jgi:hypothetical protein
MKADVAFNYILIFLLQVVLGGFLYFVGDLMLRIQGESKAVDHLLGKYIK